MLSIDVQNRIRQFNPWLLQPEKAGELIGRFLPDPYVRRDGEDKPLLSDRATLLVGPRQAGKSTLVWSRLKPLAPDILFFNMEDILLRTGCASAIDVADHIRREYPFIKAVFIDEIHYMEEAGLFVKGLVDAKLDISIWATGSSSFHLLSRTRESLAGRAVRQRLFPFSMEELLRHLAPPNPAAERYAAETIVEHQLIFGSYPAVYLRDSVQEKQMLLTDLVEALILRDASDLFRIKRPDAFRKLLLLLAGQIGSLVNLSEHASVCHVNVGTVGAYLDILDESHIVKIIPPFAGGKRREIIGAPKVFFVDNGIRNQLLDNFSPMTPLRVDQGQIFENWAFSEIYKTISMQDHVKFWRSKAGAEVDFVIEKGEKIYALEVKCSFLKEPRIGKSARSFIDAYRPERFAILNMVLEQKIEIGYWPVSFITPRGLQEWLDVER